jgi:hypothetical protein
MYFPGGGYCIPALSGHISHVDAIVEDLKKHGEEVGVLFLNYYSASPAGTMSNLFWRRNIPALPSVLHLASSMSN